MVYRPYAYDAESVHSFGGKRVSLQSAPRNEDSLFVNQLDTRISLLRVKNLLHVLPLLHCFTSKMTSRDVTA